jgi:toxin ParE1/3/4
MAKIRLSKAAETDLDQIARFGIDTFGSVAARRYRDGLKLQLARIEEAPLRFPAVDHIRPGYRRSVFKSHAIYFRIDDAGILVVRVLGRQDPGNVSSR